MNKTQKIFWLVFGLYMLLNLILSLVIDYNENNLEFLIGMKNYLSLGKYFAFLGVILYGISFFFSRMTFSRVRKENHTLSQEVNELKARLFDMQEKTIVADPAKEEERDEPKVG